MTASNYPVIAGALTAECAYRGINPPPVYVDNNPATTRLAVVNLFHSAIIIARDIAEGFTPDQMRALLAHEIRHMHQTVPTIQRSWVAELDADHASVESAGLPAYRSMLAAIVKIACKRELEKDTSLLGRVTNSNHCLRQLAVLNEWSSIGAEHPPPSLRVATQAVLHGVNRWRENTPEPS